MIDFKGLAESGAKMGDVLAAMLTTLNLLRQDVQALRKADPPRRSEPEPMRYLLSNSKTQMQIPTEFHVTGIFIGGDAAGRGTLADGQQVYPFWQPSYETTYYHLDVEDRIIIRNGSILYTPPAGTTAWDVMLSGHAGNVDQRGATQRV